ncbi:MAG: hypothetical protein V5A43_08675 [Haloarculaceae archaeon]
MTRSGDDLEQSGNAGTEQTVTHSVVDSVRERRRGAVFAVALAVLVVALVVDIAPVVRFGIGGVVFVVWMWWFVSTGVAVLDRLAG